MGQNLNNLSTPQELPGDILKMPSSLDTQIHLRKQRTKYMSSTIAFSILNIITSKSFLTKTTLMYILAKCSQCMLYKQNTKYVIKTKHQLSLKSIILYTIIYQHVQYLSKYMFRNMSLQILLKYIQDYKSVSIDKCSLGLLADICNLSSCISQELNKTKNKHIISLKKKKNKHKQILLICLP